jgi:hypothetical protein
VLVPSLFNSPSSYLFCFLFVLLNVHFREVVFIMVIAFSEQFEGFLSHVRVLEKLRLVHLLPLGQHFLKLISEL